LLSLPVASSCADDYDAWVALQQAVTVTITARSGPGPVTLVLSSLLYYCLTPEDYRNFNVKTGVRTQCVGPQ
jgi:hypothetical protein